MKEKLFNRRTAALLMCVVVVLFIFIVKACRVSFAKVPKPRRVTIKKVSSAAPKKMTIKWKKVRCSGYRLRLSTSRKFTKKTTVTRYMKKGGATGMTVSGLKAGRKYYVRIQAYKTARNKKHYGKWSKVRSGNVKKAVSAKKTTGTSAKKSTAKKSTKSAKASSADLITGVLKPDAKKTAKTTTKTPVKSTADTSETVPVNTPVHAPSGASSGTPTCKSCGTALNYIERSLSGSKVIFAAPENTNKETTTVSVTNKDGFTYNYNLYRQNSQSLAYKYPKYRSYLSAHGCSTCALTAVLNATVPSLKNYTPDMVIEKVEKKVLGSSTVNANMSKSLAKQMPIGLKGMSKILTYYGVDNTYVYDCSRHNMTKEIRTHLQAGKPVIFTLPRTNNYSGGIHTMVMLGLDKNGRVIVGDSLKQSASKWGSHNRLVKFGASGKSVNTVENITKFFTYSTDSIDNLGVFYSGPKGNIGYILVN